MPAQNEGFKDAAVRDAYSTSMPVVTVDSNTLSLLGTAAPSADLL